MNILNRLLLVFVLPISIFSADLRVGFDSSIYQNISRKDMMILTDVWLKSILDGTKYETEFFIYENPKELSDDFKSGKVNLLMSFGENVVKYLDVNSLVPAFTGSYNSVDDEYYIVLVNNRYKQNWRGLQNPKVGVIKTNTIEKHYFDYHLLKDNKAKNIQYENFTKSSRMLLRVFFNQLDLCMVPYRTYRTAVELNPQILRNISIVERTDITTLVFGFYKQGTNQEMMDDINDIAVNIKKDARGKSILDLYKADGIKKVEINDLKPIEKLLKQYSSLKKSK